MADKRIQVPPVHIPPFQYPHADTFKQHMEDIIWDRLVREAKIEIVNECIMNGKFKIDENGEVTWNKRPLETKIFAGDDTKPYMTLKGEEDASN